MASVRSYLEAEKSGNTCKTYKSDWANSAPGAISMPAESVTVARYLAQLADGRKVSTIKRRGAATRVCHVAAQFDSPTDAEGVKAAMRGILHTKGTKPNKKAPAAAELIARLLRVFPEISTSRQAYKWTSASTRISRPRSRPMSVPGRRRGL